jgi:hypothetical protein
MTRIGIDVLGAPGAGPRRGEPMTLGIPLPRGLMHDASACEVRDGGDMAVPCQTRALDRWADGSIRWMLLDFPASLEDGRRGYWLVPDPGARSSTVSSALARLAGDDVLVETGRLRVRIRRTGSFPFDAVESRGPALDPLRSGLVIRDRSGAPCRIHIERVSIEEAGPCRARILWQGTATTGDAAALHIVTTADFFATLSAVRFRLTLRNPRRAEHPGNCWELGDRGSIFLRDVSLHLARPDGSPPSLRVSAERGAPWETMEEPFELYQESSGGPNWRSPVHVNCHGQVPHQMSGYRLRTTGQERRGTRATPIVWCPGAPSVDAQGGSPTATNAIGVAIPEFWQHFPRALEATGGVLSVRLFPEQYGDPFELQGGEQKTHDVWVAFGDDDVSDDPMEWCRTPSFARASPEWYSETGAVTHLLPAAEDPHRDYRALVDEAIEGPSSFLEKRESIDEYGWRHFGDLYADHEAVSQNEERPFVSHYNNQYDAIAGFACQFMMTGDQRWWTQMCELAAHVKDIDLYHTTEDKAAYNGGLFWHTYHYVAAGKSSHRSYPRGPGVSGGGPGSGHNYNAGLVLHYFLTGDDSSKAAAIQLAQWVVDMDDGSRTVFRWLDRGPTGVASMTASADFHGAGRGPGNSIEVLLNGFRLSGNARYLEKAEELIRRCIHPADDFEALDLLNAEMRWSYTIFLAALGSYLDLKIERGEIDTMYAYARASLVHYATWMVAHERPYLETPEKLEYPTETWAAQDIRKCEVLCLAARHVSGGGSALVDRAGFFFRYAVETLARMPTHVFTRPRVLLLSHGFMFGKVVRDGIVRAPEPRSRPSSFGAPSRFVGQKDRAIRRAVTIAALAAMVALGALVTALL